MFSREPRPLAGKVVLISGCSSGIGEATALACAREGAILGLCARREERLNSVADRCRLLGAPEVVATAVDISSERGVEAFVASVVSFGAPYALVNNAGSGWTGPFATMPTDDLLRVVSTNFVGAALLTRAVLPSMQRQGSGVIVMVASVVAFLPIPYMALYSATKAGLAGLAHALDAELTGTDVKVSVVYPASTSTEFYESAPMRTGGPGVPAASVAEEIVETLVHPRRDVLNTRWRARRLTQPLLGARRARAAADALRARYPDELSRSSPLASSGRLPK